MTHPLLRDIALLLPPLRRLVQGRDAARAERDCLRAALEARIARLEEIATEARAEAARLAEAAAPEREAQHRRDAAARMAEGNARVEQALSLVRQEYTVLPRFGFHQPLDYETDSLPPRFGAPVLRDGEALPLPAPEDRFGYPAEDAAYLRMGAMDAAIIRQAIDRHLGPREGLALLDFGCSSGRVLRHFEAERRASGWHLHGVDIQARPIEWLRLHFPPDYTVSTGTVQPHLAYPDNSLDVIYGFSVFTHIKYLWDMWLMELRRVLKPGGLLLQTLHTETAWAFYHQHRDEDWVRRAHSPRLAEAPAMPEDWFHHGDIAVSQAFWKAETARRNWSRYLEVLELLPPQHDYS
ncbi:MAG: hypothetical protein B7Z53_00660, partial [Rhodospirillales bacterium 12-71-4]